MNLDKLRIITLGEILAMPVHPVADSFPMLKKTVTDDSKKTAITLAELADSITENGLQVPMILFNGQLMDGRNRRAACEIAAKVEKLSHDDYMVDVKDFLGTEDEADDYIFALNLHRRDITQSQRAEMALQYWPREEARAKERQGTRTDISNISALMHESSEATGKTSDALARRFLVSGRLIDQARKLVRDKEDKEASAVRAAEEAARQRGIAEVKRAELEAAKVAGETLRLADTATAVNDAVQAAAKSQEEAYELQEAANRRRNALDKIKSGEKTLYAVNKDLEAEQPISNDECQEAIGKAKTAIQTAVGNFKKAITTLADCSDRDETEYEFIAGKVQSIIEHFEKEFGIEIE